MGDIPTSRWTLKRGLNRLFLVLSICWYIAAGFMLWQQWQKAVRERQDKPFVPPPISSYEGPSRAPKLPSQIAEARKKGYSDSEIIAFLSKERGTTLTDADIDKIDAKRKRENEWQNVDDNIAPATREDRPVGATVAVAVAPFALYGSGLILLWIARGFRNQSIV